MLLRRFWMYYSSMLACDENSEWFVTEAHSTITMQIVHTSVLYWIYFSLCRALNRFIFQKDFLWNILYMGGSQYSNVCLSLRDTLQLQVLFKFGMYERMIVGVEIENMKGLCSIWRRYSGICMTVNLTAGYHVLVLVKPATGADDVSINKWIF